ncbi:MAG: hypothetical protein FWC62_06010 [Firmicutes bacterium]|nr:hypothetical protein [Bacillota bacterium]
MNRRVFCFIITALFLCAALLPLTGCGAPAMTGPPSPTVRETPVLTAEATPTPAAPSPSATETPSHETASPYPWAEIYLHFLTANYDSLNTLCYGGIAGVGFIDLDLDGAAELLLFDAGASAAMGVQFFDIVDGQVVCISANNPDIGTAYGAGHFTDVYVDANYFEDFRLMQELRSGERYFLVESGNGDEGFLYREVIRFGRDGNGTLTLTSLLYRYESYSPDAGGDMVLSEARYAQGGQSIGAEEYTAAYNALFAAVKPADYTPAGAFIWENKNYDGTAESFLALVQTALSCYAPIPDFNN